MKILIIDTSHEKSMIWVVKNGEIIRTRPLPSGPQSSSYLIESLSIDVDLIAVSEGPGLLTGIRVGIAAAEGLSLGLGVPCVRFSSLVGYLTPGRLAVIDCKGLGFAIQTPDSELTFCHELPPCDAVIGPNLSRIDHPHKLECSPDPQKIYLNVCK